MALPLSYKINLDIKGLDLTKTLEAIADSISSFGPNELEKSTDSISFSGGFFRLKSVSGFNPLTIVHSGKVNLDNKGLHDSLEIRLTFTRFFILTLLINVTVLFIQKDLNLILYSTIAIWGFFYMGNCFIAIIRLKYRLNRILIDLKKEQEDSYISPEQKTWIDNEDKCPACGHEITKEDETCPDCGLKIY